MTAEQGSCAVKDKCGIDVGVLLHCAICHVIVQTLHGPLGLAHDYSLVMLSKFMHTLIQAITPAASHALEQLMIAFHT